MRKPRKTLQAILFQLLPALFLVPGAGADTPAPRLPGLDEILPPRLPWEGASRELVVADGDPWITPCEQSGLRITPRYEETMQYLERLCAEAPELRMLSIGQSPEGRDLWMVIASGDRAFTPEALRATGKPTLLAQAGIHSGEIDGKDAGMMLLRDMTVRGSKRELLQRANFLFIPILSVDAHERFSAWSRINQRGPEESGWRTNSRNLNLNRDYSKLDTAELQHLVRVLGVWEPDLYIDLHVTDGADYQYDITFGSNGPHAHSPAIAAWLETELFPAFMRDLRAGGHVPGPLVFAIESREMSRGVSEWTASPRFSTGYGDIRHLPTVLVENHSLKPYDQRVLGTYVLLESALRTLAERAGSLRSATASDRSSRRERVPLDWAVPETEVPTRDFLGIGSRLTPSSLSGALRLEWTGEPVALRLPVQRYTEPVDAKERPDSYWVPPAWHEVIERLRLHGVAMERIEVPREVEVEMYRVTDWELGDPFEGHIRVTPTVRVEKRRERFPAGSVRIPTDQDLGDLVMLLLEPESPDSFFQWGFFLEVLQRTEYAEAYVLEPLAEKMLAANPELRREFERKLLDEPKFASDPRARLYWFYERTPWFDERWRLYPVARE